MTTNAATVRKTRTKRKKAKKTTTTAKKNKAVKPLVEQTAVVGLVVEEPTNDLAVICNQQALCNGIDFVATAISRYSIHPILDYILLEAKGNQLTLTTFNLKHGIQISLEAEVKSEGRATLPSSALQKVVQKLPQTEVILTCQTITQEDGNEQKQLKATLSSQDDPTKTNFELRGCIADEFPQLPEAKIKIATLPSELLATLFKASSFSISNDETKQVLNGAYLCLEPNLKKKLTTIKVIATNGHTLALATGTSQNNRTKLTKPMSLTIPIKVVQELKRSNYSGDEQVDIYVDIADENDKVVSFVWENRHIITRTIAGEFPDCETIIKSVGEAACKSFQVERFTLIQVLERFAVLSRKEAQLVLLALEEDSIKLSFEREDIGKGSSKLPGKLEGEPTEIAFNIKYLLSITRAISTKEILLRFSSATEPALIQPYGIAEKETIPIETEYVIAPAIIPCQYHG